MESAAPQSAIHSLDGFTITLQLTDTDLTITVEDEAFRCFRIVINPEQVSELTGDAFNKLQFLYVSLLDALEGQDLSIKIHLTQEGKLMYLEERNRRGVTEVKEFTLNLEEKVIDDVERLKRRVDVKTATLEAKVAKLEEENMRLKAEAAEQMEKMQRMEDVLESTRASLEDQSRKMEQIWTSCVKKMDSLIVTKIKDMGLFEIWTGCSSENFKLLYRGSRDGFTAQAFHAKCDGIRSTLTVIRSDKKRVFGGYTDEPWDSSNTYKTSSNMWIYSLDAKAKYKFKDADQYGIHAHYSFGPTFGYGYDIKIATNCNTNNGNYSNHGCSYELPAGLNHGTDEAKSHLAGSYNFLVEEIEVFQLV